VSAVEAVIGLGLFLLLYNKRGDLDSDNISSLRG
jgi:NADH:ubiquinone oxidoreductase subunit K